MYVHPVLAPDAWAALTRSDLGAGFVVANTANGPGAEPEQAYREVLARLVDSGTPLVGYLDSDYGRREPAALAAELDRWRRWYGITGVFLDRIASHPAQAFAAERLVDRVRAAGASRVVVNPGVLPDPSWCRAADLVVTFEGSWADHGAYAAPRWLHDVPSGRLCHLVHSVPRDVPAAVVAGRVAAAGAGIAGVSHDLMPNPWTGLPAGA